MNNLSEVNLLVFYNVYEALFYENIFSFNGIYFLCLFIKHGCFLRHNTEENIVKELVCDI